MGRHRNADHNDAEKVEYKLSFCFSQHQEEQRQKYQENYKLAQLQDVIESETLYKQEFNL